MRGNAAMVALDRGMTAIAHVISSTARRAILTRAPKVKFAQFQAHTFVCSRNATFAPFVAIAVATVTKMSLVICMTSIVGRWRRKPPSPKWPAEDASWHAQIVLTAAIRTRCANLLTKVSKTAAGECRFSHLPNNLHCPVFRHAKKVIAFIRDEAKECKTLMDEFDDAENERIFNTRK
jgi:hypothetical protein